MFPFCSEDKFVAVRGGFIQHNSRDSASYFDQKTKFLKSLLKILSLSLEDWIRRFEGDTLVNGIDCPIKLFRNEVLLLYASTLLVKKASRLLLLPPFLADLTLSNTFALKVCGYFSRILTSSSSASSNISSVLSFGLSFGWYLNVFKSELF